MVPRLSLSAAIAEVEPVSSAFSSSTAAADLVSEMQHSGDAHFVDVFAKAKSGALKVETRDLSGRTAIISGANSGIGYSCALKLASMRCLVILACRDPIKAAVAKQEILDAVPHALVETMTLDLASLASCRAFVSRFHALGLPIDFLVHNAGFVCMRKTTTEDGYEASYAANFLGSFYLTLELLPFIPKNGRIVLNSSTAALDSQTLRADKLNSPDLVGKFDEGAAFSFRRSMQLYARSKAAQVLFAQELGRRLRHDPRSIIVSAVHPGVVASPVWSRPEYPPSHDLAERADLARKVGLSCDDGAAALLNVLIEPLDPKLSGAYYDREKRTPPPIWCADAENSEAIWRRWEADAGVRFLDAIGQSKL